MKATVVVETGRLSHDDYKVIAIEIEGLVISLRISDAQYVYMQRKGVSPEKMFAEIAKRINNPAEEVKHPDDAIGCMIAQRLTSALCGKGILYQDLAHIIYHELRDIATEQKPGDWLELPSGKVYERK